MPPTTTTKRKLWYAIKMAAFLSVLWFACLPQKPSLTCRPCPCESSEYTCQNGFCIPVSSQRIQCSTTPNETIPDQPAQKEPQANESTREPTPEPEPTRETRTEPTREPTSDASPQDNTPPEPPPTPQKPCAPTRKLGELQGHTAHVNGVAFLAKDKAMAGATGDVVVTSSTDKSIRFWDLNTRKQLHTIPLPQTPYNVQVSPDGQWLAFSVGKIAQIWSIKQGKLQYSHSIQGHQDAIKHLKFTNNGAGLVTSGYDKAIFLWNTQSGKKLLTLEDKLDPIQQAPGIDVNSSGSLIIVTDYSTQLVRTMSLSTGEVFQRYVTPNGATVATFLKDGSAFLYARTASATIDIWFFLGKPNLVFEGTGHTGVVQFLEAHPKGPWVASAGTDTTIHVWRVPQDDTDKGALVKVLKDHQSRIMALGFSPDGTKLVSSSFADRKVIVWGCPTE